MRHSAVARAWIWVAALVLGGVLAVGAWRFGTVRAPAAAGHKAAAPLAAASAGVGMPAEPAALNLRVQPLFNGQPLLLHDVRYRLASGDLVGFSRLAFLMTKIVLIGESGQEVPVPDADGYFDADGEADSVALRHVPVGRYRAIRFHVGVDAARNHADPAGFAAGHALNPLVNNLHWDWAGGYVFFALEGRYELTGDEPGRLGGFVYHVAEDTHLMTVQTDVQWQTPADRHIRLDLDLAALLNTALRGRLSVQDGSDRTHSRVGDLIAPALVKSMPAAWRASVDSRPVSAAAPAAGASGDASRASLPAGLHPASLAIPAGFSRPELPADNPLSEEGIALGQRLFSDTRLSINGKQSCASCHVPARAFSDGIRFSRGARGTPGTRNAQPLFNLAWNRSFTWDGRRQRMRDQALAPIADHTEMALPVAQMLQRLNREPGYREAFSRVFAQAPITAAQVGLAIEQYLLSLVSADSRFDRAMRREEVLSAQELEGLRLFLSEHDPARGVRGGDCFHCHGGPLLSNGRFHNNGLQSVFKDRGRELVTGRGTDAGLFKTPSLRNVALTAPYMHDGRFKTLEEVVEHYSSGTKATPTLDPNIAKHPNQAGVDLSGDEKAALVAFLKTLTDPQYAALSAPARR